MLWLVREVMLLAGRVVGVTVAMESKTGFMSTDVARGVAAVGAHCVRAQVDPVVLDDLGAGKRVVVVLAMRRVHSEVDVTGMALR